MGKRRSHSRYEQPGGFWRQQLGGMPLWGIAVAVVFVGAMVGWVSLSSPQTSTADPNRQARPVPSFSFGPSAAEEAPRPALVLPPAGSAVLMVGDSWTDGQSLDDTEGFAPVVANAFEWGELNFGERGTGYVSNLSGTGDTYPERLGSLPGEAPGIVLLQGGLNDAGTSASDLLQAAQSTLDGMRDKYPTTPIVVVGPATTDWPINDGIRSVDAALDDAVGDRENVYYLSPISDPWFNGQNIDEAIGADGHPTSRGYQIYADRLIASLRTLAQVS